MIEGILIFSYRTLQVAVDILSYMIYMSDPHPRSAPHPVCCALVRFCVDHKAPKMGGPHTYLGSSNGPDSRDSRPSKSSRLHLKELFNSRQDGCPCESNRLEGR